jgi:hypothetical protein
MSNIYYSPEDFGLVLVDSLDEPDLSYEYHTLIVLQHTESGRIFYAEDSGCSCPTPFEDFIFSSPDNNSLLEIQLHTFSSFEADVKGFSDSIPLHEREAVIDNVKKLLKG